MHRNPFRADWLCLVTMMICLLAGCGPAEEAARPVELAPVTLRWVTWEPSSQAEQMVIKQFQESHPQVEFQREAGNASPSVYLAQTPPPDLLNMDVGYMLADAVRAGMVADLTELWAQNSLLEAVPASVQKLSAIDGKQYYLPVAIGWEAIYYNKQVFAQYGLEPPQTWAEFLVICDTLMANGETPLAISGNEPWNIYLWFEYLNLRINGAAFHRDLLAGRERYDDPRVRNVLETWRSLFVNGYFIEDRRTVGGLAVATALVREDKGMLRGPKAAMALLDTYTVGSLPAPFQAELDFFRFPIMDPSIPVANILVPFGYVVPVGAEHLPATMAFLSHVSSPAAQAAVAQQSMFQTIVYAPARTDVELERLSDAQRRVLQMIQEGDEAVLPLWFAVPRQMFGLVRYEISQFVTEPYDVDRFIQKFEEARQKMVSQGLLGNELLGNE